MSSSTRKQLETWLGSRMVSGNVLDVGGSQLPIESRVHKMPETEFFILDLEKPHVEEKSPDIIFDIDTEVFHDDMANKFDFAFCIEVSEYWINPLLALSNIAHALKKGGKLFISFHFIYPVHNPIEFDSLRYTRGGVLRLLKSVGLGIVSAQPRTADNPDSLTWFYQNEGMRPAKGYDFHKEVGILIEAIKL